MPAVHRRPTTDFLVIICRHLSINKLEKIKHNVASYHDYPLLKNNGE